MTSHPKFIGVSILLLCFILCGNVHYSLGCTFRSGKYDLSTLGGYTWPVVDLISGNKFVRYDISICSPLNYSHSPEQENCVNSSICRRSDGNATSLGDYISSDTEYAIYDNMVDSGFSMYFRSSSCLTAKDTLNTAVIHFICGEHLGSPKLVMQGKCNAYFWWETSAACEKSQRKEVPCYVIDSQGNKRDLTNLIQIKSGYIVQTYNPNIELMINVCSSMLHDHYQGNCLANSSACRIYGTQHLSFGEPQVGLQMGNNDVLTLTYTTENAKKENASNACVLPPKTTIFFRCPQNRQYHYPKVISEVDCQYEIEWNTQHACPEATIKGDFKECRFYNRTHGVDIDLSPLRRREGTYSVAANVSGENSTFLFNVCSGLGETPCNGRSWLSDAVCIRNSHNISIKAGSTIDATLFYVDGNIFLSYERGENCTHEKKHKTIINFICNNSAEHEGFGRPEHISSSNCLHLFKWDTKYACPKVSSDIPCYAITGGKSVFDLSILRRNDDEGLWLAVDEMFVDKKSDNASYFLNVCGSVPQNGFFNGCGNRASVCRIDNGKYLNLGTFASPPTYNTKTKSVWLEYKDGSQCRKDKRWQSLIEFSCKPGQFTSPPVLMNINSDSCTYEFLWQSARACPVSTTLKGDFCRIRDSSLGIDFDLSPLKSEVHKVQTEKYSYSIGVCSPLITSVCNSLLNTTTHGSIGACQYQESDNGVKSWVIGESNSHLSYYNGVVNLTYGNGDPYNDVDRTPRKTVLLFMCDMKAGLGNPIFIEEVKYTYIFHWYTNLVCTEKISTECTVYDTVEKQFYDLSSLSKSDSNWNLFFEDDNGNVIKAYINVCRHLTPTANCGSNAAVCFVNHSSDGMEASYIPNLGRAVNELVFSGEGNLELLYSHGQLCNSERNVSYSTVMHFICSKNAEFGGPRLIGKVGDCQYAFLWATEAACPTGQILVKNECSIIDPVTGFIFDLSSLKRENAYNISAGNRNFQINVCEPIGSGCRLPNIQADMGNVSVCEMDREGNALSILGTTDEYSLQYFQGSSHIVLRYKNGSNSKKSLTSEVLINLRCDMSSTEVKPHFIKEEGSKYFFEIRTPLTCLMQNFVCEFVDSKGNEYDLSPLSRKSFQNWNVEDNVSGQNIVKYLINFCRPLNRIGYIKTGNECPGGATAACEKSSEGSFSLGSQYSAPNISENGVLTLLYTNGSPCANGLKRSARINLICSYKQGNIVFVGKTPECEYLFSLHTPVACSLQTRKGHNCSVRDPNYGYDFNLNPLQNASANFSVVSGDYVYYLNVCDKLQGFSGVCENSSVCQTKAKDSKFSKSLGIPNSEIYYSKGIISLTYLFGTEKCHKKYSRSTTIKFTCDHGTSGLKEGPVFISETEDCTYLFEWATKYACPPFRVVDCVAGDSNGFLYDLSPLSLSNDNYYLKNPFHANQTFVINICRSVVHSSDSICPYESASCLLDSSNLDPLKRSLNLGEVSSSPFFGNGTLKISYTLGDKCDSVKGSSAWFMETVIGFTCDKTKKFSEPEYVGRDDCIFYFTWATAFACPINTPSESVGNCTVNDPVTDYEFDLSPLMSEVHILKTSNHVFSLNVCGSLENSPCSSKSGICQSELTGSKRSWNTGNSNANLLYHEGSLFLNYSGGDSCHNNMFKRNSIIQFECGEGIGEPKFLSESFDCTYYFVWKTKLACQHLVHCGIKNGSHFFDLHALAENSYYSAESGLENDNSLYYISVCNAFTNLPNPLCPTGSSLCRVFSNGTAAESLGNVEYPPFVDFEGHATIIYTNGSQCSSENSERNAARVIFQCDITAYLGEPVLIDKPSDCLYIFEWKSSIVCPPDPSILPKISCSYADQSRGVSFDLTPLRRNGSYYEVTDELRRQNYRLNLCDSTYSEECGTSAVCQKGESVESYGSASSISFSYDGERLRAIYTDGDDCLFSSSGKRTSEIIFICDMNAGLGKPKLSKKYTCLVVFTWETNLVCKSTKHSCSFDVEGKHYDFHLLSSLSHNWRATDDQGNFYLLNLCRGLHSDDINFHCPSTTAVCLTDNKGFSSSLGIISTMKANLTDAGELMLSYTLGSSHPCTSLPAGNTTLNAAARIFLSCGNSLGTPVWRSGPKADCVFDFDWKTSLACERKVIEMTIDNSSILIDKRFGFQMDLGDILNRTFHVPGHSNSDLYIYVMNLKLGYSAVGEDNDKKDCAIASVCQTKPNTTFQRDIGSLGSMKFQIRGTELHLLITSYTKPCGKNRSKNVTTLINMQCSTSAEIGSPSFFYESGDCDYIFIWETHAVCPQFYRQINYSKDGVYTIQPIPYKTPDGNAADLSPNNEHQEQNVGSSNNAMKIVVTFIAVAVIVFIIIFVFSSAHRRSAMSLKCRGLFNRVHLPRFRYRRGDMLTELQSDF